MVGLDVFDHSPAAYSSDQTGPLHGPHGIGEALIAALYVQTDGVYFNLPDVDPWDETRDARQYKGPHAVVAHPPCQRWSMLAHIHKHKPGKAIGNDGGCFYSALSAVRLWGGVLEHPAGSAAWDAFGLIKPPAKGGWWPCDSDGGYTCHVEQGHYGHRARKATWLYACKAVLPDLVWGQAPSTQRVDFMSGRGKERSRTPLPFRDLLIQIARSVKR